MDVFPARRARTAIAAAIIAVSGYSAPLLAAEIGAGADIAGDAVELPKAAFVVGITNYSLLKHVPSGVNDATSVGEALGRRGFDVTYSRDDDYKDIWQKFKAFIRARKPDDIVIIYLSGHGFQWQGLTFFAAKDTPEQMQEDEIDAKAIAVDGMLGWLYDRGFSFTLILLDACRTINVSVTPAPGVTPVQPIGSGLPLYAPDRPTVVGTAASAGQVAYSATSTDDNSPYTKYLVKHIDDIDQPIEGVLAEVDSDIARNGVDQKTVHSAWGSGGFYLNPGSSTFNFLQQHWLDAKNSRNKDDIARFVDLYPGSRYEKVAKKWLEDNNKKSVTGEIARVVFFNAISEEAALPERFAVVRDEQLNFPTIKSPRDRGAADVSGLLKKAEEQVAYAKSNIKLFAEPRTDAEIIEIAPLGSAVSVVSEISAAPSGWTKIKIPDQGSGLYVYAKDTTAPTKDLIGAQIESTLVPTNEPDVGAVSLKMSSLTARVRSGDASSPDFVSTHIPVEGIGELAQIRDLFPKLSAYFSGKALQDAIVSVEIKRYVQEKISKSRIEQVLTLKSLQVQEALIHAGFRRKNMTIKIEPNPPHAEGERADKITITFKAE